MESNSIESLLLRHYGNAAPAPAGLEEQLYGSVRHKAKEVLRAQLARTRLQQQRLSRRQAVRLMVKGAGEAGVGLVSLGLEGLQVLETALVNQETRQPVLP